MLLSLDLRASSDFATRSDDATRPGGPQSYRGVLPRAALDVAAAVDAVRPVCDDVRVRGDAAVRDATARFDGVQLTDVRVPEAALKDALEQLDPAVRDAL